MPKITREVHINAPKDKVWAILADLGAVQDYNPNAPKAWYTSEMKEGVGASRHCDLVPMGSVEERVIAWNEGDSMTIEIYEGKKVPFLGVADLILKENSDGTTVTMDMDLKPRNKMLGSLLGKPMTMQISKAVEGVLNGLKHHAETGELVTQKSDIQRAAVEPVLVPA